jgi:hypothetical protein
MVKGVGVESMQAKVSLKAALRDLISFYRLDSSSLLAEVSQVIRTLTLLSTE